MNSGGGFCDQEMNLPHSQTLVHKETQGSQEFFQRGGPQALGTNLSQGTLFHDDSGPQDPGAGR